MEVVLGRLAWCLEDLGDEGVSLLGLLALRDGIALEVIRLRDESLRALVGLGVGHIASTGTNHRTRWRERHSIATLGHGGIPSICVRRCWGASGRQLAIRRALALRLSGLGLAWGVDRHVRSLAGGGGSIRLGLLRSVRQAIAIWPTAAVDILLAVHLLIDLMQAGPRIVVFGVCLKSFG